MAMTGRHIYNNDNDNNDSNTYIFHNCLAYIHTTLTELIQLIFWWLKMGMLNKVPVFAHLVGLHISYNVKFVY